MNRLRAVAGSLGLGLAIAFVMQMGSDEPGAPGKPVQASSASMIIAPATNDRDESLELSDVTSTAAVTPAEPDEPMVVKVAADADTEMTMDQTDGSAMSCPVELTGTAKPAAMVNLTLLVSCMPGETVTMHHSGMMFTAALDDTGQLQIDVPALDTNAVFVAALPNGEGGVAVVPVPDISDFARVAVQWQGPLGVELHAREFGAEYGSAGHHWSGATGRTSLALDGRSGFLTRLGGGAEPALQTVEVYTYPIGASKRTGEVILSVESEITRENCGRTVAAQTIELQSNADGPKVQDLTLDMPECDAVGDFLVLQTLLQDLKIAAR